MAEGEETKSVVKVDYVAEDHASATAKKIAAAYREPAKVLGELKEKFREFRSESLLMAAGALGVGFGLGSMIDKAKEANLEFEGTRKSIGAVMATMLDWPRAMEPVEKYRHSVALAKGVTQELDDASADFGVSLGEMGASYKTLLVAAAPLHLTQQQLLDLTIKSTAAAKQFGIAGTEAADAVGKSLVTRTVKATGDFGLFMRENLGKSLAHLNNPQLLSKMDKALSGSVDIAKEMGQGMGGSISRIQHDVDDLFRSLSGPVFSEVAKTLGEVSKYLKSANAEGKPMVEVYGQKLVGAFRDVKDATMFVADHWKTIAVIWASFKVPKGLEMLAGITGGIAGNGGGGLAGIFRNLGAANSALGSAPGAGSIVGFLGALGPAVGAVGALAGAAVLAGNALKGVYDEWQTRKHAASELGGFFKEVGEVEKTRNYLRKHDAELSPDQVGAGKAFMQEHAALAAEVLKQKGLMDDGGIAMERFTGVMDSMSDDVRKAFKDMIPGAPDASSGMLGAYAAEAFRRSYQAPAAMASASKDEGRKTTGKNFNFFGPMNITQKFEESDPDRVMVRTMDELANFSQRRTQSALAEPNGL